jgi:hypothetical protein
VILCTIRAEISFAYLKVKRFIFQNWHEKTKPHQTNNFMWTAFSEAFGKSSKTVKQSEISYLKINGNQRYI